MDKLKQVILSFLTRDKSELETIYNAKNQEFSIDLNGYLNTITNDKQKLQRFIDSFKRCSNSIKESRQAFLVAIDVSTLSSKLTNIKEFVTKLYDLNVSLDDSYRLSINIDTLKASIDGSVSQAASLLANLESRLAIQDAQNKAYEAQKRLDEIRRREQETAENQLRLARQLEQIRYENEQKELRIKEEHERRIREQQAIHAQTMKYISLNLELKRILTLSTKFERQRVFRTIFENLSYNELFKRFHTLGYRHLSVICDICSDSNITTKYTYFWTVVKNGARDNNTNFDICTDCIDSLRFGGGILFPFLFGNMRLYNR